MKLDIKGIATQLGVYETTVRRRLSHLEHRSEFTLSEVVHAFAKPSNPQPDDNPTGRTFRLQQELDKGLATYATKATDYMPTDIVDTLVQGFNEPGFAASLIHNACVDTNSYYNHPEAGGAVSGLLDDYLGKLQVRFTIEDEVL